MTDPKAIAAGLSEAQRRASLSASATIGGDMQVWHAHLGTIKSMWKRGLCTEPNFRGLAIESPLGLAVRKALQEQPR